MGAVDIGKWMKMCKVCSSIKKEDGMFATCAVLSIRRRMLFFLRASFSASSWLVIWWIGIRGAGNECLRTSMNPMSNLACCNSASVRSDEQLWLARVTVAR